MKTVILFLLLIVGVSFADTYQDKLDTLHRDIVKLNGLLSYFGTEDNQIPADVINQFNAVNREITRLVTELDLDENLNPKHPPTTSIQIIRQKVFFKMKTQSINLLGRVK